MPADTTRTCKECERTRLLKFFEGRRYTCRDCRNHGYQRVWRARPEVMARAIRYRNSPAFKRRSAELSKDPVRRARKAFNIRKHKYGVTKERYFKLFEKQKGKCGVCGCRPPKGDHSFHIDHNHRTGKVRGLLCRRCNNGLGFFRDQVRLIRKAVRYLKGER